MFYVRKKNSKKERDFQKGKSEPLLFFEDD